ncbi:hydrogenase maturation nickel metallochaperone HypA [Thermodesulfobium sp.]|jgi:hydrogenase nickel incorporation protein HypA/HybF
MHEASIVQEIIDITTEQAKQNNAKKILEVEITVGAGAMIETDLLASAFDIMKYETMLENATLKINKVNLKLHCLNCGKVFESNKMVMECPNCHSFETIIESGREMLINKIIAE